MDAATVARTVGTAARLTRLVALDSLLDVPRAKVEHWANARKHGPDYDPEVAHADPHWLAKLVGCTWCAGFWVSAGVVASAHAFGHTRTWKYATDAFAVAFTASALVNRADD